MDDGSSLGGGNEVKIHVDSSNNIWLAGALENAARAGETVKSWHVRLSGDAGSSYNDATSVSASATADSEARFIVEDASGNVYIGGYAKAGTTATWKVQRMAPSGVGFVGSEIESFQYSSGLSSAAHDGALDSNGNLYVVGYGNHARDNSRWATNWVVRKRASGGASFSTVDDFTASGYGYHTASAIFIDNNGVIYVAGTARATVSGDPAVFVRKSTDGSTWATLVEAYQYNSGATWVKDIAVDSNGTIYLNGDDGSNSGPWWIRKSTDGSTWTTDFEGTQSMTYGLGFDASGALYGLGAVLAQWTLEKKGTDTWENSDFSYQYVSGSTSAAHSMSRNLSGNLYVAGLGLDGDGNVYWLVRKLAAP